ncbi:Serpentine type 7TM GPCR chemoreceptor Srx [Nesidiocoris tenuis]|uniref:Thyrotropin-releasing hormone receptor n=1 Tax=Nesidiocoris tenuis TaxID=355587 RepID=A0ABN7AEB4_9HEMI|nr:Serpentine type 7TM GPCR chemoreceptor Srx [Nesidiocoris tenuis]
MLAVVVVVFAVLWLPYRGLVVYNSFITLFGGEPYMDLWFLMFAKTCVYINSAINPILYNAMSMKFRRAFHSLLQCGERSSGPGRGDGENGGHLMRVSTVRTTTTTTSRNSRIESTSMARDTTAF